MILVLLGTSPYGFDRLACAMDDLAKQHGWDVFIQTGNTKYKPSHCRYEAFLPHEQIEKLVSECEVLVTQGGAGSIHEGLACGRPVVAVPRLAFLNETKDQQSELVQALEHAGRLIGVYNIENLYECIQKSRTFNAHISEKHRITELIANYIDTIVR